MTSGAPRQRVPVAVLGATGAVGQAFVRLLATHPWFDLVQVAASERSAGRPYAEAVHWIGADDIPERVRDMRVVACDPAAISAPVVFSALDASVAQEVEPAFARAGRLVLSNASSYRMEDDVPLVTPDVNPDHLRMLDYQRRARGWEGGIVTNANCSSIVAVSALAPLHREFGLTRLFVATMQAVSGAGYPGVPSLDILGNVIPFIRNEEEKIETEILKMLGRLESERVSPADIRISAHANRVPVLNGHTVCMSLDFASDVTPAQATAVLREWQGDAACRSLPTAPIRALLVTDDADRPQPRRDADRGNGMTVTVGRVRRDAIFAIKLVALGHNIVLGAAGASVLNAELLVASGQAGIA
jgi:aspartate-semialdehyde dehydrogenase